MRVWMPGLGGFQGELEGSTTELHTTETGTVLRHVRVFFWSFCPGNLDVVAL